MSLNCVVADADADADTDAADGDYSADDDTYNDTLPNYQIYNNSETININTEHLFWKAGKDYNNGFSCNNNHNQDLENCFDDRYGVHPENIDSNLSKISNDGERVVLINFPEW